MSEAESCALLGLIRQCNIAGRAGPWIELLRTASATLTNAWRNCGVRGGDVQELQQWFPGWLFEKRKLHALIAAVERKLASGECASASDAEVYASNYLYDIARAAYSDFYAERSSSIITSAAAELERLPATHKPSADDPEHVLVALARLPVELRIPFRLKFLRWLAPIPDEELNHIASLDSSNPEEIRRIVDEEQIRYSHREFPLSSRFIGELLHIECGADGRPTAVDQRISRARALIWKHTEGGE